MFEAVKELTSTKKSNTTIYAHNEKGQNICSDVLKAEAIRNYFEKQFSDTTDGPLPTFDGPPRPLDNPIPIMKLLKPLLN